MIEGALKLRSIDEIVDEMTESYMLGDYLEGMTRDGDDALMSPRAIRGQVPFGVPGVRIS